MLVFDDHYIKGLVDPIMHEDFVGLMEQANSSHAFIEMITHWVKHGREPDPEKLRAALVTGKGTLHDKLLDFMVREYYITHHGFVVPLPPLFEFMKKQNTPILEVGAGHGTLGKLARHYGIDFISTDIEPVSMDVEQISAADAINRDDGRSLILNSWPSINEDWLADASQFMKPGQKLLYIGEGRHGCTGSDKLFDVLDAKFKFVDRCPDGVFNFHGMHDVATLLMKSE